MLVHPFYPEDSMIVTLAICKDGQSYCIDCKSFHFNKEKNKCVIGHSQRLQEHSNKETQKTMINPIDIIRIFSLPPNLFLR